MSSVTIFEQGSAYLKEIHINLSNFAMIPILGSIPAAAKALLGVIEFVAASILFVLALIPSICSVTARRTLEFSAQHIGRGLIRTVVGSILAVPILGIVLICGINKIVSGCCGTFYMFSENGAIGDDIADSCIYE